ncbi:MAG: hypothetical protein U9R57_02670, partial [Thermodesulfobacteriota bacterium]|nr:hypothetical protein [Thermodesulfobacteriota bacterium]
FVELNALRAGFKKRMSNIEQGISNIDRNKRRKIKGLSPSAVRHSSESALTCSIFDIRPLMFGSHFLSFVKNENSYAIKLLTLRSLAISNLTFLRACHKLLKDITRFYLLFSENTRRFPYFHDKVQLWVLFPAESFFYP